VSRFLCIHGHKNRQLLVEALGQDCIRGMERCELSLMTCMKPSRMSGLLYDVVKRQAPLRMGLGQFNDVGTCWPNCDANLTKSEWNRLQPGLYSNAACSVNGSSWKYYGTGCCGGTCLPKPREWSPYYKPRSNESSSLAHQRSLPLYYALPLTPTRKSTFRSLKQVPEPPKRLGKSWRSK
jgi:hypothetical protein